MKKRNITAAVSTLMALLLVAGASAFMGIGRGAKGNFDQYHEDMEKLMEEGKYSDLVAYREKIGFNIMPMATDERSFQDMQEMHKTMEEFHEKYGSGMDMGGMGYGWMGFGWLFQIIILVLFFAVIWWMFKNSGNFGFRSGSNESAIDILKKRLAKGEISRKEYEELKREIEK